MRLVFCRQDRITAPALLAAAALGFAPVVPAQTNLQQRASMAKTDLPRVFAAADHVLADFNGDGDMDVVAVVLSWPPGCNSHPTRTPAWRRATSTAMASSTC